MFQRILVEDWATYVPFISFFLIAGVFVAVTIRALRIEKRERERLASMPLEDPSEISNSKSQSPTHKSP
jgi:cbb3-type cytochrome oxidase subunit 3